MIIAKSSGKEFDKFPLPEAGTTQAVCCGVWDLGMQESTFNGETKIRHKVVIAWELDQLIEAPESEYNGKPYMLSKTYTLSLFENAALKKDLESWRGKSFSQDEIDNGFDIETLYGINCLIGVAHVTKGEKTYANVSAILPPTKGMTKKIPVRAKDEAPPKWVVEKQEQAIKPESVPEMDDFPFDLPNDEAPY